MQKQFPPEFSALMAQYRDTSAGLGHDHKHSRRLWLLIEHTAPAWFKDEMMSMARQMGLIPTARMCNDQGERMFTSAELAAHLGMSHEQAKAAIDQLIADRKALGLPVDGFWKAGKLNTLQ